MRIGIDIDDTLVSTSESFEKILKKYNINFNKKFKDKWSEEEKEYIFEKYLSETLENAEIKENAKNIINYLSSLGHDMIIITARNNEICKDIEQRSIQMIKRENLNINKFYFGQRKKSDIAKKLKIDLMIDDDVDVYNNMKIDGIDCILFGDKIKNWIDVLEYIKEKEE